MLDRKYVEALIEEANLVYCWGIAEGDLNKYLRNLIYELADTLYEVHDQLLRVTTCR